MCMRTLSWRTNAKAGRGLLRACCKREQMHAGRKGGEAVGACACLEGGEVGGSGGGSSLENLHAMVAAVSHDHAPVAVDGDAAIRVHELPVA